jgi:quercetin dioxygenase-like cupin family protein
MDATTLQPFNGPTNLERSRWFMGSLFTFLAMADETGGQFSCIDITVRKGTEIPPHMHTRDDESFYILEGEILCHIGGRKYSAKQGEFVFLPRNIPHTWEALTDTLRFLLLITPAGGERVFWEFSEPAPSVSLPPESQEPPSEDFFRRLLARDREFGVTYEV